MRSMKHPTARRAAAVASVAALALGLAACATGPADTSASPAADQGDTPDELWLAESCPSPLVIQMDYKPQAEYGAAFNLIGPGYTIDPTAKAITGPLTASGFDTGVEVEVRNAIPGQLVASTSAVDEDIFLSFMSTDDQISAAANGLDFTAVVAPLRASPVGIIWDPAEHPEVEGIQDIAAQDMSVIVPEWFFFTSSLIEEGILRQEQIINDQSSGLSRMVADPTIAQFAFVTSEPYILENLIEEWNRPVGYDILANVGYDVYSQSYAVRSEEVEQSSACLEKLVPIIQQATADYYEDGSWAIDLIVESAETYNEDWEQNPEQATFAWEMMREVGIVGDENGVMGGIDMARVESILERFTPILEGTGVEIPEDLTAEDLATDQFIDPTISVG
jgi:hypothetical protein